SSGPCPSSTPRRTSPGTSTPSGSSAPSWPVRDLDGDGGGAALSVVSRVLLLVGGRPGAGPVRWPAAAAVRRHGGDRGRVHGHGRGPRAGPPREARRRAGAAPTGMGGEHPERRDGPAGRETPWRGGAAAAVRGGRAGPV